MRNAIVVLNVEDPFLSSAPGLPRVVDEAYRWYREGKPVIVVLTAPKGAAIDGAQQPCEDLAALFDRDGIPATTARCSGRPCYPEILRALERFPVVILQGLEAAAASDLAPCLTEESGAAFAQLNLVGPQIDANSGSEQEGGGRLAGGRLAGEKLKIGLLGLGVVGRGVYQSLSSYPERFEITGIAVRDVDRPERLPLRHLLSRDPWSVVNGDADVVIELIGGHDPAYDLIAGALRRGKHVVTANKLVLSQEGEELLGLVSQHHGSLHYAAAVGGAVPMLEAVRSLRRIGRIESLQGVLNGTCNFVLDELAQGRAFPEAVERAQTLGFAEADPTLDLDGTDTAHKLTLLARAACGAELKIENVDRQGILELDSERVYSLAASGKAVRLVASLADGPAGWQARVAPQVVDGSHPFARLRGEQNCLIARHADGREQVLRGKGAGRWPTTVSVMSDVLALGRTPLLQPTLVEFCNREGAA
ncbi:MAG TPA: homoserine dehydrogenase [Candidatus Saccharimonadales bacterium]|jgi:homoserine dehydrogenase|nr:homoserine dehydrogenase [Candidatus Saccharimonadales bacterium]